MIHNNVSLLQMEYPQGLRPRNSRDGSAAELSPDHSHQSCVVGEANQPKESTRIFSSDSIAQFAEGFFLMLRTVDI